MLIQNNMSEEQQKIIISHCSIPNIKSAQIFFDGKGKLKKIEVVSEKKMFRNARIYEYMSKEALQVLTIKTRTGDAIYGELTRKYKF
jgi:hypothetical protein